MTTPALHNIYKLIYNYFLGRESEWFTSKSNTTQRAFYCLQGTMEFDGQQK
jgi:hypothetical protein